MTHLNYKHIHINYEYITHTHIYENRLLHSIYYFLGIVLWFLCVLTKLFCLKNRKQWAFATAVKTALGTHVSSIEVLEFEFWLHSKFQSPLLFTLFDSIELRFNLGFTQKWKFHRKMEWVNRYLLCEITWLSTRSRFWPGSALAVTGIWETKLVYGKSVSLSACPCLWNKYTNKI